MRLNDDCLPEVVHLVDPEVQFAPTISNLGGERNEPLPTEVLATIGQYERLVDDEILGHERKRRIEVVLRHRRIRREDPIHQFSAHARSIRPSGNGEEPRGSDLACDVSAEPRWRRSLISLSGCARSRSPFNS